MSISQPRPKAAYIHVPFCAHRCGYCDFTVAVGKDHLAQAYVEALDLELNSLSEQQPVETLFIGGGTPTHLPAAQLDELLQVVRRWFGLAPGAEFSIEANPAGLDDGKIAILAKHGVNRVSLGVQSFDSHVLKTLERDHDAPTICDVVSRVALQIPNVGLDLIFGVPGQALADWEATLSQAVALKPTHLSTYGLTFEKGTAFWSRRAKGEIIQTNDELERSMYALAMKFLPRHGYEQYELSNFAQPNFHCRHNEIYWAALPFFGFGPGAARYLNGRRETNHRSFTTWLSRIKSGQSAIADNDELSPIDRAKEAFIVGLRRITGVERASFQATTGYPIEEVVGQALEKNLQLGLLEETPTGVRLTLEGRFLADSVIVDCL